MVLPPNVREEGVRGNSCGRLTNSRTVDRKSTCDKHMSPLRRGRGHCPAYVEILSGVGGPTSYSTTSDWREIRPFISCESVKELVKERTERKRVKTFHPCRVPRRRAALRHSRWS